MNNPTLPEAVNGIVATFEGILRGPDAADTLASFTFNEIASFAEVLRCAGRERLAAVLVYGWLLADGDHGCDVDEDLRHEWIARLPEGHLDTSSSASRQHYIDTGLYLPSQLGLGHALRVDQQPTIKPGDSFERFGYATATLLGSADNWDGAADYLEAINDLAVRHLGLPLRAEEGPIRQFWRDYEQRGRL